jgi:hypothetical protein
VVLALHAAQLGSISSLAAVFAATFIGRRALPHLAPASARTPVRHSRSDLPVRLVATATMVVSLTGLADQLGPNLSGLLNAFPVLTTIIAVFTHAQRGRAAMVDFLNGYLQSVVGFALFCVVMATTLPWLGLNRALIAALMVQFASHAFLLWRVTRAGSSAGT